MNLKDLNIKHVKELEYLKKLIAWHDKTDIIKIVTGIRRCGKSTLFKMFKAELQEVYGVEEKQIQSINFEDVSFSELLDWKKLHDHLQSNLVPDKMNYLFWDEIQAVESFERAVNSLRLKENVSLYLTGSNSQILSGELATLLSGRYITIHIQPLSFKEFVSTYKNRENTLVENKIGFDINGAFTSYLRHGSFLYALQILSWGGNEQSELIQQFLKGLFDTIILKDVVERKGVKDIGRLNKVVNFIFDNIGSETSVRNIKNSLESDSGLKIDVLPSKIT